MTELKDWPGLMIATVAVLAAAFLATTALNWPGHLSFDSLEQLLEGRTGLYNTWHPPVMAWLLGLFDAVVPGAALFVVFDATLVFGALFVLLRLGRAGWWSVATAVTIVLLPQMLLYQGIVWKDVLFADAAVAAFTCLALVAHQWKGRGQAAALLLFALLTLAGLARQNGAVLLPFAAGALAAIARTYGASWRQALLWGSGSVTVVAILIAAFTLALDRRSNGDSGPAEQLHVLALYDLSGAVAGDPGFAMTTLRDDDPALEAAIRTRGAKLYTPLRNDPIMSDRQIQTALSDADTDAMTAAWRDLIVHHTALYLRVRAADFFQVFATPDIIAARPVFTGVEGPADMLKHLGIAARQDARDVALKRYGFVLLGTPVWSHPAFAVLALGCLVILLRRRQAADIAVAAMLLSAFAFAASFFAISISCDYRYLYFLDLSALAALFYLSLDRREAT